MSACCPTVGGHSGPGPCPKDKRTHGKRIYKVYRISSLVIGCNVSRTVTQFPKFWGILELAGSSKLCCWKSIACQYILFSMLPECWPKVMLYQWPTTRAWASSSAESFAGTRYCWPDPPATTESGYMVPAVWRTCSSHTCLWYTD